MTLTQFDQQTTYMLIAASSGVVAVCVGFILVRIKRSRRATTEIAEALYEASENISELQRQISILAKHINDQPTSPVKSHNTKQLSSKIDRAIALAELGVSATNIQQETGLPEVDVSAIIKFHTASLLDLTPYRTKNDEEVSIQ